MFTKTQLDMTLAIAGATLSFACGRAVVGPDGPDQDLSYDLVNERLSIQDFDHQRSLPDLRLSNLQVVRSIIPPIVTIERKRPQTSGPQLTEWNRSSFSVGQLDFLPMIYETEAARYQVHFDNGELVMWAVWEPTDRTWIGIGGNGDVVKMSELERPLMLWSDLLGAVELRDCERREDGMYACNSSPDASATAYFPTALAVGEGPLELTCMENCPAANANAGEVYYSTDDHASVTPEEAAVAYRYDPRLQTLFVDEEPVEFDPSEAPVVSGFMFKKSAKHVAAMACTVEGKRVEGVCAYKSLEVFYTWTSDASVRATGRYPAAR